MSADQAGPAGEPDPSMEEILASIRRILAEDTPPPADLSRPPQPDAGPGAASGDFSDLKESGDEVIDLDPAMLVGDADNAAGAPAATEPPPVEAPPAATVEQAPAEPPLDLLHDEPMPHAPALPIEAEQPTMSQPHDDAPPPPAAPPPAAPPGGDRAGLVDPTAAAAAASSVGSLVRTLAAERSAGAWRGGPTLEDLVREELRPLLKAWLDTHLPPLVERLVRAEIERVVGRTEI